VGQAYSVNASLLGGESLPAKAGRTLRARLSRLYADRVCASWRVAQGPLGTRGRPACARSNVSLRQNLESYAGVLPIANSPASRRAGGRVADRHVVFRENTEDIYAGIEFPTGSRGGAALIYFLQNELRSPAFVSGELRLGSKPVSKRQSAAGAQGHPVRH